ncbi:hypothetical protein K488DRAFT_86391 [Vararia minispora EC-137]|uniref:Uncharacterized protein n=1 Tax=Vararia minispora EC-137 TaxID=1314806 RepID=A0ACB8QJ68_9AGAM|nr:hypothetical protein K488DRAFT_86391 [Vararia minispora EC-137]
MSNASNPPTHLVALPSLSSHLSSLPQAKSIANVPIYTSSMAGHHAAHSEAKVRPSPRPLQLQPTRSALQLRQALSQTSQSSAPAYASYTTSPSQSPAPGAQPLMMRKPVRTK